MGVAIIVRLRLCVGGGAKYWTFVLRFASKCVQARDIVEHVYAAIDRVCYRIVVDAWQETGQ